MFCFWNILITPLQKPYIHFCFLPNPDSHSSWQGAISLPVCM